MKYYIIAGERSGDLHAGNLVHAIKQWDPEATFRGFGGEYLQQQGVELTVHYNDLAFMGLVELITNLNKIRRYIKLCKNDIVSYKPDAIILVDYGGFNQRIARFGKLSGIRIIYYIPPKYWAWGARRALNLKPYVDRLFVILPFEKEFFKKFRWEAHYVGNPVLDAVKAHKADPTFLTRYNLSKPYIAFLPGSRKQELRTIIPLLAQVARKFSQWNFGVAAVSNLDSTLYDELKVLPNVVLVFEETYDLLINSTAAVVTSGTATLETALFRVPQVVVYIANPVSFWAAKMLIQVAFVSLVNLIAGREVVKELLQNKASAEGVSGELQKMVNDLPYRTKMLAGYDEIIGILDTGSASENAARMIAEYMKG